MAKSIHVKAKTQWRTVEINKNAFDDHMFDGLVDIKELTDYEFIQTNVSKKLKKTKAPQGDEKKVTASKKLSLSDKSDGQNPSNVNDGLKKKKGRSRKKNKDKAVTADSGDDSDDGLGKGVASIVKVNGGGNLVHKENIRLVVEKVDGVKKKKGRSRKKKNDQSTTDGLLHKEGVQGDGKADDKSQNESSKKKKKGRKRKKNTEISDSDCPQNKIIKLADPSDSNNSSMVGSIGYEGDTEKGKFTKKKQAVKQKKKTKTQNKASSPDDDDTAKAEADNSSLDMSKWNNLFIPPVLLQSLQAQGFQDPTTIQTLTLPSAIRDHKDILAAAETGSGKTLAFGIPVIAKILSHQQRLEQERQKDAPLTDGQDAMNEDDDDDTGDESDDSNRDIADEDNSDDELGKDKDLPALAPATDTPPLGLILEPTRELAVQVHRHLSKLAKFTNIKFALVVGGMSVEKQRRLLKHRPEVVIATPGRLWQLIEEGDEHLRQMDLIHSLVVDEADRMVEKGHYEELTRLLHMINKSPRRNVKRQSFVMSATLTMEVAIPRRLVDKMKPKDLHKLDKDKLKSLTSKICVGTKPKVIDLTPKDKVAQSLTEMRINCGAKEKDFYLYYFLSQHPGRTLVFANSKDCLRRLVSVFTLLECSPYPLHADMQQRQRLKNLDRFSGNDRGLLLASDVAARGLDIPNVDYVIHYQVPQTKENYVHRSGRTARASNVGLSVMLVAPEDARNYRRIIHGVKNGEELPLLPIDMDLIPAVKGRVDLARTIDVAEHRSKKVRLHNDFFSKAAEEMDMILDEKILVPGMDDSVAVAEEKNALKQLKRQLTGTLQGSLAPLRMTKYPTKSGKLLKMKSVDLPVKSL